MVKFDSIYIIILVLLYTLKIVVAATAASESGSLEPSERALLDRCEKLIFSASIKFEMI